jgi:hypothetical protein
MLQVFANFDGADRFKDLVQKAIPECNKTIFLVLWDNTLVSHTFFTPNGALFKTEKFLRMEKKPSETMLLYIPNDNERLEKLKKGFLDSNVKDKYKDITVDFIPQFPKTFEDLTKMNKNVSQWLKSNTIIDHQNKESTFVKNLQSYEDTPYQNLYQNDYSEPVLQKVPIRSYKSEFKYQKFLDFIIGKSKVLVFVAVVFVFIIVAISISIAVGVGVGIGAKISYITAVVAYGIACIGYAVQ